MATIEAINLLLTLTQAGINLLTQAGSLNQLLAKAHAEGRDVSAEEFAQFQAQARDSEAAAQAAIDLVRGKA